MKLTRRVYCLVILGFGILPSCSSQKINVNLDSVVIDTVLNVSQSTEIVVRVYENKTTGYAWTLEGTNESVELVKEYYKMDKKVKGLVGAGNTKVYVFKTLEPGVAKLSFTYSRSWEPKSGNTKTILLTVD